MTDPLEGSRWFIHTYITSVDHFRVLLLLYNDADRHWLDSEVVGRLRLPPPLAQAILADLVAKGFLTYVQTGNYFRYQPRNSEIAEMVTKLADLDRERPVSLIRMIYSRPSEPQAFADAFRIIKKKEK